MSDEQASIRTRAEMLTLDRTKISITDLRESDEREFWLSRSPVERLAALELLREIAYCYEPDSLRLQRVLEIVVRPQR